MKKAVKTITDGRIETVVEVKLQAAFTEAVGSYELKINATKATIDNMKEDEYLLKLWDKILTNDQIL